MSIDPDLEKFVLNPNFDPVVEQIFGDSTEKQAQYTNRELYIGFCFPPSSPHLQINSSKNKTPPLPLQALLNPIYKSGVDFGVFPMMKFGTPEIPIQERVASGVNLNSRQILRSTDWSQMVVGEVSEEIFYDPTISPHTAGKCLLQEFKFFYHLSLPAVSLPTPIPGEEVKYAQIINSLLSIEHFAGNLYIRIPLHHEDEKDSSKKIDFYGVWNRIRRICKFSERIGVNLVVTEDLPDHEEEMYRWIGENLKVLTIPTKVFLNRIEIKEHREEKKKVLVSYLTKAHERYVSNIMPYVNQIIFEVSSLDKRNLSLLQLDSIDPGIQSCSSYIRSLHLSLPKLNKVENYISPYRDIHQIPLQPLAKNLTNLTYMLFEKDPVKYDCYQSAVERALKSQLEKNPKREEIIVMVLGAGRGPLIKAVYRASAITGIKIKVYAVEKNENAIVVLRALNRDIWDQKVDIIETDIRHLKLKDNEKADIVVSELLGSFGDNELSPECLSPIGKFLQEGTGISVPCSSTSFLVPACSSKLFLESKKLQEMKKEYLDMAYVTNVFRGYPIAEEPKKCFYFHHPPTPNNNNLVENNNFSRYEKLEFVARVSSRIDGLIGYFESTLFEEIKISILPKTKTKNMFSWFPIWFPIGEVPIDVKKGEKIAVHFWRCQNEKRVWYEWQVSTQNGFVTRLINQKGQSYFINK